MKLFPFEKITYKTDLSKEEILQKIDMYIVHEGQYYYGKEYYGRSRGKIVGNKFRMKKIVNILKRPVTPILIEGSIDEGEMYSSINLKIRYSYYTYIHFGFFYLIFILFAIYEIYKSIVDKSFHGESIFSVIFTLSALYAFFLVGFKISSDEEKSEFKSIFK